MPWRAMLRTSPAVWLALPIMALAGLYTFGYSPATTDPYPLAHTSAGAVVLGFVAPICAAISAWESGRLQRAGLWRLPHARAPLVVAARALLLPVVVGMLAVLTAAEAQLLGAGLVWPDLRILGVAAIVIASHALLGFAVGTWLPVVVAAPTVLLVGYLWMALPRAFEPLWVRHLNGSYASCCTLQSDLAPGALLAVALVCAGFVGAAYLLLHRQQAAWQPAAAAAALTVGLVVGAVPIAGLGPDPTVARSEQALVCRGEQPEVCVWPEHTARLPEVLELASQAHDAWRSTGLAVPRTFSEGLGADVLSFGFSLEAGDPDVLHSMAFGMLPPLPACASQIGYPAAGALEYVHAWLDASAGMADAELQLRFQAAQPPGWPPVLEFVAELRTRSPEVQRRWAEANLHVLGDCESQPMLDIPG